MACPLDCGDKHALMLGASPRDSLRNNSALLRDETLKFLVGLIVNKIFFVVAESAGAFLSHLS